MLGGMANVVMLKDQQGTNIQVGFGLDTIENQFDLEDNVGINERPVEKLFNILDICWVTIVQRVWPQELNFFHIDSPTRRLHCMAHYGVDSINEEKYKFHAWSSGLPDSRKAFADAQEFTWSVDNGLVVDWGCQPHRQSEISHSKG
eukprot:863953-Amphidinium_carterae.1